MSTRSLWILSAAAIGAWAADSAAPKLNPPAPTVTLNVTAVDASGRPATGLTCADFQVFDEGHPQPLLPCPSVGLQPPSTMVVWDLLNSIRGHRGYQSDLLIRALESLQTNGSVYLYILTNRGEIYPVHPLPAPGQAEPAGASWTRQIRPLIARALDEVTEFRPADYQNEGIRAGMSFLRLTQLEDGFSRISGPKTMVWITTGSPNLMRCPYGCRDVSFPGDSGDYVAGQCTPTCPVYGQGDCIDYGPFLRRFSAALGHDLISLYSVEETPIGKLARADRGSPKDTLQQFADLTGGRRYGRGELSKALDASLTDAAARYPLAFESAADGRYHTVRIIAKRPGIHVEAPTGYYAEPK